MGSLAANAANAAMRVASSLQRHERERMAAQTMGVKSMAVAPCSRGRNQALCLEGWTLVMTADSVAMVLRWIEVQVHIRTGFVAFAVT